MPHLSPLNWMMSPIMFWIILGMFISTLWWSQSLQLPKLASSLNAPRPCAWSW